MLEQCSLERAYRSYITGDGPEESDGGEESEDDSSLRVPNGLPVVFMPLCGSSPVGIDSCVSCRDVVCCLDDVTSVGQTCTCLHCDAIVDSHFGSSLGCHCDLNLFEVFHECLSDTGVTCPCTEEHLEGVALSCPCACEAEVVKDCLESPCIDRFTNYLI